jgi:hypothetical protein
MSSEGEKHDQKAVDPHLYSNETTVDEEVGLTKRGDPLHKDLQGRHMQMIAIGKASIYSHCELACLLTCSAFRWCYWCRSVY